MKHTRNYLRTILFTLCATIVVLPASASAEELSLRERRMLQIELMQNTQTQEPATPTPEPTGGLSLFEQRRNRLRMLELPIPMPTPEPEPEPEPTTSSGLTDAELRQLRLEVIQLTNARRQREGLAAYASNGLLTASAQGHAEDMAKQLYFNHIALDDDTPQDRMEAAGYPDFDATGCRCSYTIYFGENIAMGQVTAEEVVQDWMDSPPHRDAILSLNYTEMGIGIARANNGVLYWVQNFGAVRISR
jgi:uncharacterized protein YkwD